LLAILVLIIAIFGGIRLAESIYFWKTLIEYGAHPLYTALSGFLWLVTGLLLVWGVWRGLRWAWRAALFGTIVYTAWYWLDRLIVQRPHMNDPFSLITTALLLMLVLVILFSRRTRNYFL
jgi:hypothetical protein